MTPWYGWKGASCRFGPSDRAKRSATTARGRRADLAASRPLQSAMPMAFRARLRHDKKGGDGIVGGVRCPIAGRISMDTIIIEFRWRPPAARRGALVALLDDDITVDELGFRRARSDMKF